jgi:aspartate 1-decarboxylase
MAGILPYEKVAIYNVTNGNRLETYAIAAARGSGEVCINGAAAHQAGKGDIVIIACYAALDEAEAKTHKPSLVYVDERNVVVELKHSIDKSA